MLLRHTSASNIREIFSFYFKHFLSFSNCQSRTFYQLKRNPRPRYFRNPKVEPNGAVHNRNRNRPAVFLLHDRGKQQIHSNTRETNKKNRSEINQESCEPDPVIHPVVSRLTLKIFGSKPMSSKNCKTHSKTCDALN